MVGWRRGHKARPDGRNGKPVTIREATIGDIAPTMGRLFPGYMFCPASFDGDRVMMLVYRKGTIFTFVMDMDEVRSLWLYQSLVPLERRLRKCWEESRDALLGCMAHCGEPEYVLRLMEALTADCGEGFRISGIKVEKEP